MASNTGDAPAAADGAAAAELQINVKTSTGSKFTIGVGDMAETVAAFKERLSGPSSIPAGQQRLIYRGHVLKDTQTLGEIKEAKGLEDGHTMHLVRGVAPKPAASTPSSGAPAAAATTAARGSGAPAGARPAAPPAAGAPPPGGMADPFGLLGTGGFGGGGFGAPPGGAGGGGGMPGAGGQVPSNMADMQRQMMQNPGAMQQMMNSPMMQSLLENPELLRTLMMANPQVRELMERNPELAGVLNDPATMRQTMQAARNPDLMNEMVRNTDRQMANIEAMPGGFDALRRMYENVQAPLMDATAGDRKSVV